MKIVAGVHRILYCYWPKTKDPMRSSGGRGGQGATQALGKEETDERGKEKRKCMLASKAGTGCGERKRGIR